MRLISPLLVIHLGFMALLPLGAQGTKADYERWAGQQELTRDKDFDLIVMTSANHGSAESPYGRRRRADFFVRHL